MFAVILGVLPQYMMGNNGVLPIVDIPMGE